MPIAPKVLFLPVTCDEGIGEYMRSKIVADEIQRRWPDADIQFVIGKQAPYINQCPYPVHVLDETPTKCVKEVNQLVDKFKPQLVIFDASGRQSQLKHAKRAGCKVVFISQHKRKRARGMKIGRALATDSHWVVQPEYVIGDISAFSKFKLDLIKRPYPIITGCIFAKPQVERQQQLLSHYQLQSGEFFLLNAGSGGHRIEGKWAAEIFAETAQRIYQLTGTQTVMVFGPNYKSPIVKLDGVVSIDQLDTDDFIAMLSLAKAAVLSGGDTLLQAIALRIPTLAVAVSKDQPSRIKCCESRALVLQSDAETNTMANLASTLVTPSIRQQLINNMQQQAQVDGLEMCMSEVTRLLTTS